MLEQDPIQMPWLFKVALIRGSLTRRENKLKVTSSLELLFKLQDNSLLFLRNLIRFDLIRKLALANRWITGHLNLRFKRLKSLPIVP